MPTQLTWTDKQREIYKLLGEGKEFKEITDQGYTKNMVSRVKTALAEGQKPVLEPEKDLELKGSGTTKDLVGLAAPKSAPIVFKLGRQEIALDPLELYRQYRYYEDLARKDGKDGKDSLGYSFSQVLTLGMQLIWILKQDIPITENMLTAIFYG